MKVEIAPRAAREIVAARAWWREHRAAAPELFDEELAHAIRIIGAWPHAVGAIVVNARTPSTRRYLLGAIGYVLVYRIERDIVGVVRFRHMRRRPVRAQ